MLRCKPFACITLLLLLIAAGCKKDSNNENGLLLKLTPDNVTGKSGRTVEATLSIVSTTPVKSIVIAPAKTGKVNNNKIAVTNTLQTNKGNWWKPKTLIFTIVVMKLIAPNKEDTPAK